MWDTPEDHPDAPEPQEDDPYPTIREEFGGLKNNLLQFIDVIFEPYGV